MRLLSGPIANYYSEYGVDRANERQSKLWSTSAGLDNAVADSSGDVSLAEQLECFRQFGTATRSIKTQALLFNGERLTVPTFVNEFWTAEQRQASSLQEVSYRACFKPQLPRFFIERLTQPGDIVYDPSMGRGTTPVEAALLGRIPWGNDINPLSQVFIISRLRPPTLEAVAARLREIDMSEHDDLPDDLLVFYHADTLREICALRTYFLRRASAGVLDVTDVWLRMVAMNRLTGHSPGFFSVYTLPPNQAVSVGRQRKINQQRNQTPPRRVVVKIHPQDDAVEPADLRHGAPSRGPKALPQESGR